MTHGGATGPDCNDQSKRFLFPPGQHIGKPMILKRLFQKPASPARLVYEAIVAAARHPRAYAEWGVADTVDGRFDMISLHAFLVLDRLKGRENTFRQALVDELFRDMDRSLREMGVSDVAVGKKVRKMAEVFYGRVAAYDRALTQDDEALRQAIARNVFPDGAPLKGLDGLTAYMIAARRHLASLSDAALLGGNFSFTGTAP